MRLLDRIFTSGAQKTYLKKIEELKPRLLSRNYKNLSIESVHYVQYVDWITQQAKESILCQQGFEESEVG